jgi:hypothetical protein
MNKICIYDSWLQGVVYVGGCPEGVMQYKKRAHSEGIFTRVSERSLVTGGFKNSHEKSCWARIYSESGKQSIKGLKNRRQQMIAV